MKPKITKKTTRFRLPISPEETLAIALRFLSTGETYKSLMYQYRVGEVSISRFVPEACQVIIESFIEEYMSLPDSNEKWLSVAKKFEEKWQFPNCVGAIDGKHVPLINLFNINNGSTYVNYKSFFSIALLALVDDDYKFLYVSVGCQGRISDGGVFQNSELYHLLVNGEINLPDSRQLPDLSSLNDSFLVESNRESEVPYIIVADDAFPLSTYCMKPYSSQKLSDSKRIFGYRLSRARCTTENAFGILSNRFRVLSSRMDLQTNNATKNSYSPSGLADEVEENGNIRRGEWRDRNDSAMQPLAATTSRHPSHNAEKIRDIFREYFYGRSQVSWQWKYVN